jgi:molybdopterin synthase catalytic subunit
MTTWARVTRDPIEADHVLGRVGDDSDGAVVVFLGVVRDHNEGAAVTGVSYDAYEEMAGRVLSEIGREAAQRLGTDRLAVVHRIGDLAVGDVSVAIAASSPHRAEAFDAARYVIEEIKKRLPVWKKEHYVTAESRWLEGRTPAAEAPRD